MKRKYIFLSIIFFAFIVFVVILLIPRKKPIKKKRIIPPQEVSSEPVFRKDGELIFYADDKAIKKINIEIAKTEATRTQGLMYRRSMPDSCGMLFIFEGMQPLSFWMKNTYIPLDIIFIDDQFKIVSIAKNTVPLSEKSIPSGKDAMYVVEVNAGFCDRYGISEGNKILYNLKTKP